MGLHSFLGEAKRQDPPGRTETQTPQASMVDAWGDLFSVEAPSTAEKQRPDRSVWRC